MFLAGLGFFAAGIAARCGRWKSWYWASQRSVYGYLPVGLLLCAYAFDAYLRTAAAADLGSVQGALLLLVTLSLWWMLRPPSFVKPSWVRWVESYPLEVRHAMRKAVQKGDREGQGDRWWKAHVANPTALAAWAETLVGDASGSREGS